MTGRRAAGTTTPSAGPAWLAFPSSSVSVDGVPGQSFTSYYDLFTVGAGYVDIQSALANNDALAANALSPTVTITAGKASLVFPAGSAFSAATATNVVWGSKLSMDS